MDVGKIEERVQSVLFVFPYCAVTKAVGMEGNIDGEDGRWIYGGGC